MTIEFRHDYTDGDYERTFNEEWKRIVCDKDGNLILEQVMKELHDYSMLMENASLVYNEFTPYSKPHTDPKYVIQAITERYIDKVD
jgi:hypothetical protein